MAFDFPNDLFHLAPRQSKSSTNSRVGFTKHTLIKRLILSRPVCQVECKGRKELEFLVRRECRIFRLTVNVSLKVPLLKHQCNDTRVYLGWFLRQVSRHIEYQN